MTFGLAVWTGVGGRERTRLEPREAVAFNRGAEMRARREQQVTGKNERSRNIAADETVGSTADQQSGLDVHRDRSGLLDFGGSEGSRGLGAPGAPPQPPLSGLPLMRNQQRCGQIQT